MLEHFHLIKEMIFQQDVFKIAVQCISVGPLVHCTIDEKLILIWKLGIRVSLLCMNIELLGHVSIV